MISYLAPCQVEGENSISILPTRPVPRPGWLNGCIFHSRVPPSSDRSMRTMDGSADRGPREWKVHPLGTQHPRATLTKMLCLWLYGSFQLYLNTRSNALCYSLSKISGLLYEKHYPILKPCLANHVSSYPSSPVSLFDGTHCSKCQTIAMYWEDNVSVWEAKEHISQLHPYMASTCTVCLG